MEIDELFSGETIVAKIFKGYEIRYHFREMDSETDLAYQRRLARTQNGKPSDEARVADIWLFDQLCTMVEVVADGEIKTVPDFKARIAPDVKRAALFEYRRGRILGDDEGN
jgi:hypothetical protein